MIAGEAVILAAVYIYIRWFLIKTERKRLFARMQQTGSLKRENVFFQDRFCVRQPGKEEECFPYSKIVSERTTPNLLILKLASNQEVILEKSGFTQGTLQVVEQLISKKNAIHPPAEMSK